MLKEPEIFKNLPRRSHRTYTREFKAQLVAACQQPGASVAALARSHGMNANVLHRWLKEHELNGRHPLLARGSSEASPAPAFIPLTMPTVMPDPKAADIKVELRTGALSMTITWPVSAAGDFTQWTAVLLK